MQKITVMAATLLLVMAVACSKSETVSTSSSETSSTVATTTTAATETTTSTMPVTDTIVTTGSTDSAMSTAPATSTRTTTTMTTTSGKPAATSTVGGAGRGPVTTDTVAPNKRATIPTGKTSSPAPSSTPATSTSSSTSSSSTSSTSTSPMTSASSGDANLVAEGQATFKSGCTACHGADASGNTPMGKKNNIPDFRSSTTQSRSDAELINIIQNGRGPVSSSAHKGKHLTNDQAKAVVAWIRSLK